MRRLLAFYENGNYSVRLFRDGTKVKSTREDSFRAEFPDSIDLKITDYCDLACPMCHERSSVNGAAGDLSRPFLLTLHPGTELAIGGGNPLSHNGLVPFLERMRKEGIVCNLTVNGAHLKRDAALVRSLIDRGLIFGLGVSITALDEEVIEFAKVYKNTVLHLVCGVFSDYEGLFGKGLKILMLGYKRFGRGNEFYDARVEKCISETRALLPTMVDKFECISFDNLALSQLEVSSLISKEDYEEMFMGDDGEASMYIDLSGGVFARSSTSTERYPIEDDIKVMFERIRV